MLLKKKNKTKKKPLDLTCCRLAQISGVCGWGQPLPGPPQGPNQEQLGGSWAGAMFGAPLPRQSPRRPLCFITS